jgi:hypothetical protein
MVCVMDKQLTERVLEDALKDKQRLERAVVFMLKEREHMVGILSSQLLMIESMMGGVSWDGASGERAKDLCARVRKLLVEGESYNAKVKELLSSDSVVMTTHAYDPGCTCNDCLARNPTYLQRQSRGYSRS